MRAIVQMRELLTTSKEFAKRLDDLETSLTEHDETCRIIFQAIKQLHNDDEKPMERMYLSCQKKKTDKEEKT